ncbi:tetratricopeptide repeat protein [Streptosporangiaceae bacterium NEAU-GS5]|nr:tetratricopeptide repeat protein [Streptosporangiaceae bacterium NEAU-GS5]
MSTPVLATKLQIPASRPEMVVRSRLMAALDRGLGPGRKLTLVSAPAGFGKTTLLCGWLSRTEHARVAWLSLDERDNDPSRFLTYLIAALRRAREDIGADALALLHAGAAPQAEAILTALINDVARAGAEIVLALDDYHVIDAPAVHEAVTFLLDHLPSQLSLAIAGRADPPLALSRLRSRGELTELRAADLRFTPEEAGDFLNQVMGLRLAAADVAALETRTEGWIAGLQLAALSMRGRDDIPGFIRAFTGSHRFVIDYLAEEVLRGQPEEVRGFLLRTAVLDRLTGPLCDRLTGRDDGGATLRALEQANLFVVPLDDRREWYRYHPLFADVLRSRLLSEQPALVPGLHRTAGEWYESAGLTEDAVGHALAGADFERAATLIELAMPGLRRDRQDALLLGWLQAVPEEVVRRRPVISVFYAWRMLVAGDLDAVDAHLRDAEESLETATGVSAQGEELRTLPATIAVHRASLAQALGDVAETERHARRALTLARPEDHLARGAASGFLGLTAWASGDLETAVQTFSDAVASLHAAGNVADELSGSLVLADMWLARGRPSQARLLYERSLATIAAHGREVARSAADVHVGMGELQRELGDLDAAVRHLETARELGERASLTENRYRWFAAMAGVRESEGDLDGAVALLDQAERLYLRGFFPEVRPIAAMKARVWIRRGRLPEAEGWARRRGVSAGDELTYLREYDHLTLARLLIAQERGRDALGLLDRLLTAASGRAGSVNEVLVLTALAHRADGDHPRAVAALERALAATEPEGYVRLFLDEGEPMAALLGQVDLRRLAPARAGRLLPSPVRVAGPDALAEPLSEREAQVLRLLRTDLSGPEIARELSVSLNTVRTHTKHIFTKLGVNSRRAAIRQAERRGLL